MCAMVDGECSVAVKDAFNYMGVIVTAGWAIYPLGYYFCYLLESVDEALLNVVYNLADLVNKKGVTILVVGAGFIGAEWATEIEYFLPEGRLTIVDFLPKCLGPLPDNAIEYCSEYRDAAGIKKFYNCKEAREFLPKSSLSKFKVPDAINIFMTNAQLEVVVVWWVVLRWRLWWCVFGGFCGAGVFVVVGLVSFGFSLFPLFRFCRSPLLEKEKTRKRLGEHCALRPQEVPDPFHLSGQPARSERLRLRGQRAHDEG